MGYVLVVYRFPSQSSDDFENFLSNFDQVITHISLSNPVFRLILEDFNCRSNSWWKGDISIGNQSPRPTGSTSLSEIQHIFFLSLPLGLT